MKTDDRSCLGCENWAVRRLQCRTRQNGLYQCLGLAAGAERGSDIPIGVTALPASATGDGYPVPRGWSETVRSTAAGSTPGRGDAGQHRGRSVHRRCRDSEHGAGAGETEVSMVMIAECLGREGEAFEDMVYAAWRLSLRGGLSQGFVRHVRSLFCREYLGQHGPR